MSDQPTQMCYVCNKFVPVEPEHECPQAKKMLEHPIDLSATYVHSDALPSIWRTA